MSDIAKKYVKALVESVDKKELENISKSLNSIAPIFKDTKLKIILFANDISKEEKVKLLSSMIKDINPKLLNLLKILSLNGRLDLIPIIAKELSDRVANILNKHHGFLYSNQEINQKDIDKIATNLGKRYNTKIDLKNIICDYNGIKVDVETLGIEVAFSSDRLKESLKEYILKSI